MISLGVHHFGKRTAWPLLYFLNYGYYDISPVSNSSNHPLEQYQPYNQIAILDINYGDIIWIKAIVTEASPISRWWYSDILTNQTRLKVNPKLRAAHSMSWWWTWFCESYRIMLINYFLYFLQILYILWYSFFLTRLLSFSWWTCVFESYRIMITSNSITSFRSDTSWRRCFHRISDLQLAWYRVSHTRKKSIN